MIVTRRAFAAATLALPGFVTAPGLSRWRLSGAAQAQTAEEINKQGALGDMALGPKDASVTIIEYASMTCPHCAAFTRNVRHIR